MEKIIVTWDFFIGFYSSVGNWKCCVGPCHKGDDIKQWVYQNESRDEINRTWIEYDTEKEGWSKGKKDKCQWRCGENGTLVYCYGSVKSCSFYDKQNGGFSKLKNRTTMWSSNPTSAHLIKIIEIRVLKRYLSTYVHNIIHNKQDMCK